MRVLLQFFAVFCCMGGGLAYVLGELTGQAFALVFVVGAAAFFLSGLFRR